MKQKILDLALELCQIPSISGDEKSCALFLAKKLKDLGFTVEQLSVSEERFNIFAYLKPHSCYTAIFCTHMDTVAPFIAPHFDGEKLWGRGVLDAKGIISAMVHAVLKQHEAGFDDLALLFTVGEEESSDGAKAVSCLNGRAKFLVVGEPTDLKAASFQKGSLVFDIEASGLEAHSSMPHLGDSAIHKLTKYVNQLITYPWPADVQRGETFLNIGKFSGGHMRNMVANHARAEGIMRLTVPVSQILPILESKLSSGLTLNIKSAVDPFSYFVPEGFDSFIAGFGSDAPYLQKVGQSVLLGPGSITLAHKENEHIALSELYLGALAYEKVALSFRE